MADAVAERTVSETQGAEMRSSETTAGETRSAASPSPPRISLRKSRLLPEFPYPGLRPFRKDEWPVFCGRGEIVDELLAALGATHFVPVLGTSGCGKSSIIKAGLVSTLEREHGALGAVWRATEMRPENSPMWNLTEALWRATHDDQPGSPEELSAMRASLGRGPGGIARVLQEYGFPEDRNLLILVDQFEELFRFGVLGGDEEIQLFTDQLIDVFDARPRGIHVTLTMRADFIADCARWPRLADALNRTAYLLRWLTEEEMRAAIATPARLYRGMVDADLVDRMIRDVGGKQDQLPIVQHALMWMWNRAADSSDPGHLTLADYEGPEVRGVEGALSLHADQIYESLERARPAEDAPPRDLRPCTKLLFQALSDVDGSNRVVRRPCAFGELCAITGCTRDELQYVIDRFRAPGTSFLMPGDARKLQDNDTIDVSHEALIRQWSKMQGRGSDDGWLAEERRDAENWRALAREVRKFRDAKQHGRKRYLSGDQNDDLQDWWKQRAPSAAWAARYSSDAKRLFPDIAELLEISARRARRAALARRALAAAPFVLLVGLFISYAFIQRDALEQARSEQQASEMAKNLALEQQRQLQSQLTANVARQAAEDWRATESLVLTQDLLAGHPTPITEGIGYRALSRQHLVREWYRPNGADWTRDGRFVALGLETNQVQIVDAVSDMPLQTATFADLGSIYNVAVASDGNRLAVSDGDGKYIEYWTPSAPDPLRVESHGTVDFLWFTPNGRWIVAASSSEIVVIDTVKRAEVGRWAEVVAYDVAISSDDGSDTYMASVSTTGLLSVRSFADLAKPIYAVQLSPPAEQPAIDGSRGLVAVPLLDNTKTGAAGGKVVLIDFKKNIRKDIPYTPETAPLSVRFSWKGDLLAVGSEDGSLRKVDVAALFDAKTIPETPGDALPSIDGKTAVSFLRFSPEDISLLALGVDGSGLVIDLESHGSVPLKPMGRMLFADFVGNGQQLISLDDDSALRYWQAESSVSPTVFDAFSSWGLSTTTSSRSFKSAPPPSPVVGLVYQGEKPIVVARLNDGVKFFSSEDEKPLPLFKNATAAALLDVTSGRLAYVDGEGAVVTEANGSAIEKIGKPDATQEKAKLIFDGAGRALLVPQEDGGDAPILQEIRKPGMPALPALAPRQRVLALSPRSVLLAGGKSGALLLMPTEAGARKTVELPLADPNAFVRAAALGTDDRFAAALLGNGTVCVWDTRRAALVAIFGEADQKLSAVAFPPGGDAVDAVSLEGKVYRWPLFDDTTRLAGTIKHAIPKNLPEERKKEIIDSAQSSAAGAQ